MYVNIGYMPKKIFLKNNNYLLDDDSNDENETVQWINKKKYFNCGCCNDCLCDNNIPCKNCNCQCIIDDIDDDCSIGSKESDNDNDTDDNIDLNDPIDNTDTNTLNEDNKHIKYMKQNNLSNFDINIVKAQDNQKKVRITLELNIMLDNKKNDVICIDLDINSTTYLKIAEELFKS